MTKVDLRLRLPGTKYGILQESHMKDPRKLAHHKRLVFLAGLMQRDIGLGPKRPTTTKLAHFIHVNFFFGNVRLPYNCAKLPLGNHPIYRLKWPTCLALEKLNALDGDPLEYKNSMEWLNSWKTNFVRELLTTQNCSPMSSTKDVGSNKEHGLKHLEDHILELVLIMFTKGLVNKQTTGELPQ